MRRRRLAGVLLLVAALLPAAAAAAPVRHAIDLTFDPRSGNIAAEDSIRLHGGGATAFALADGLTVERVLVDGRAVEPRAVEGQWRIDLGPAGEHEVVIRYRGRPAALAADRRDPGPVADDNGAFLPGSLPWFPRVDAAAFDFRLTLRLPMPAHGLTTGRLVTERIDGDRRIAVFENDGPAEALPLFAGPYGMRERMHRGLRLRTYFHPELAPLADDYLADVAAYIDEFAARIGPYPFAGFSVVSAPLPVGFGYPGLTYMGRRVLGLPFIRTSSLPHEVLHNWWGNGVFVDYATGNWCEGLTTYMADYALAERRGPEAARDMRVEWLRNFAALPAERDRPVVDFVAKSHDAAQVIGYNKVAFVFHMLRREIGDAAFDAGLRDLWRNFRFKTAAWADLQKSFETAAGRDLGWFFDQWLRRPGAPTLRLETARAEPAPGGGHRVVFTVAQDGPAYRLTLPIAVETAAGGETDAHILDGDRAAFAVATAATPRSLAVDPSFDLFRRLGPAEAPPIFRDVTLDARTVTVLAADDPPTREVAGYLAARLLDRPGGLLPADAALPDRPLLIVGTDKAVAGVLDRLDGVDVPAALSGRGSARAWAARRTSPDGIARSLMIVAARDAETLSALARPLPHYGRRGYVVFDGRRAVDQGTWPVGQSPLVVPLGPGAP